MKNYLKLGAVLILGTVLFACGGDTQEEQTQSMPGMSAKKAAGELTYTAPEEWIQHPPMSQMRKDQYMMPGVDGKESAELVVYYFPEMSGMVQANLDRWYGQLTQPDGSDTASKAKISTVQVDNIEVTTVYVTGTYMKPQNPMQMTGPKDELPGYAMLAAIVETEGGPWFFKATGPDETLTHWRPTFDQFIKTFKMK